MSKIKLETLTPIILDDDQKEKLNYSNYEILLDDVMSSDSYSNVALTGGYGAGKSTILNTYEKEHECKSIHISLAKLNGGETENVQAKLINQIIHQIDPKLIPQTQFKIKNIVGWKKVTLITVVLFIFITSVLYLLRVPSSQMTADSEVSLYDTFWQYKENVVMLVLALLSFLGLLLAAVNAQLKRPLIKSIQMDKSQIELVENENAQKDEKEKFDKYMDEIIYLFEKSQIDILVIEDLDRLEDVKIFYELRQINYLVNKKIRTRKIRFIYMVRDDLFIESEERTKFFDIIIPIVPVMDNSNSYDLMKKLMGDEWLSKLDKSYLKMICMYIRDYRMLKNIFNEFQIYYSQLRIEEYKYDPMKLFAMITYKNLCPTDFADLRQGKGVVYEALKAVEDVRKEVISSIDSEITALNSQLAAMQNEVAKSVDELDAIYFEEKLYKINNTYGYYVVDGADEFSFENRTEFIHALKNANNVLWNRQSYSSPSITITKEEIVKAFENLNNNEEYALRRKNISEYCERGVTRLESEIKKKRELQDKLKAAGFRELTVNGVPQSLSSMFSNDMELIRIFVQDEMIAQDYASYMTYFYPYSISSEELRYLNKVFARTNDEEQSGIAIQHPELVLEYIKPEDWDSIALPNKSLFKYMVQSKSQYLPKAVCNLKMHSNERFAAIMIREFENDTDLVYWANELLEQWNEFLEVYVSSKIWSKSEILEVMLSLLEHLEAERIPLRFINEYLHINEEGLIKQCDERIIGILEKVDYKFFDMTALPTAEAEQIYLRNLYQINKQNVEFIIKAFYDVSESENISKKQFSTIISNKDAPLSRYVEENIDTYVNSIYIPCCVTESTEVDAVIYFLNHNKVSTENKLHLIEAMNIIVDDIRIVNSEEIRNHIVKYKHMQFSRDNILAIWKQTETISDELCDFLKYHYLSRKCELSFVYIKKYFNETNDEHPKANKFINQLLALENMGAAYKNLIRDVNIRYTALTSITWNEKQMAAIILTDIIFMTEKNLQLMRKLEDEDIFFTWILNQLQSYLKLMDKEELRKEEELQTLISSEETSDDVKIECIRMCTSEIHVYDKYNTHVVEEIFEDDLFDGDFIPIIRRYNSKRYSKQFMASLGAYMVTYISNVIAMRFHLPYELLTYIMKSGSVTIANKKKLLAAQTAYFKLEEIQECLRICGEKLFLDAFSGQNPKVDATEDNRLLLEALTKQEWLSSFKAVGEQYIIYPKKALVKK